MEGESTTISTLRPLPVVCVYKTAWSLGTILSAELIVQNLSNASPLNLHAFVQAGAIAPGRRAKEGPALNGPERIQSGINRHGLFPSKTLIRSVNLQ